MRCNRIIEVQQNEERSEDRGAKYRQRCNRMGCNRKIKVQQNDRGAVQQEDRGATG